MSTIGFVWLDGPVDKREAPEAASQSFKKGDAIYLVAGAVTIAAADTKIAGIAEKDASGVATGSIIPFHAINPDQLWIAQSDTTTAQAQEGNDYGLNISAGDMSVNIGETAPTGTAVVVQQLDPSQAVGVSGGRYIIRFKAAVCQMITG